MNLNAPELMEPVFRFLDGLVSEYGLFAYMVMVWASPFVIVWILKGGLRRKWSRPDRTVSHIVIIHQQAPPPLPPSLPPSNTRDNSGSFPDSDEDSFAA